MFDPYESAGQFDREAEEFKAMEAIEALFESAS